MIWPEIISHLSPVVKWLSGPAAAAFLGAAWKGYTAVVEYREARRSRQAVTGQQKVVEQMRYILNETPADYVQLIHVHNGGGKITAGLSMYMTCLFEVCRANCRKIKKLISGLEVDDSYRDMVARLLEIKDGAADVTTVEDEFLQAIYEAMGARYTRSILLATNRKGIFFIRCTSSTEPLNQPQHQLIFRKAVSALRKFY